MEEAETAKRKYFDRLEKAVTQANFVDEVSAVRKEILVEVRRSCSCESCCQLVASIIWSAKIQMRTRQRVGSV